MGAKDIHTRTRTFSPGQPSLCLPMTAGTESGLLEELVSAQQKKPDLLEWRADFFEDLSDPEQVERTAARIRGSLKDVPLLFTIRSKAEGGQNTSLSETDKIELYRRLCSGGYVDMIDYEWRQDQMKRRDVQTVCSEHGVIFVVSFHDFSSTPPEDDMLTILKDMESAGADAAKLAVMPETMDDVLSLLKVTRAAQNQLDVPVITMSMGKMGVVSRIAGWQFGSLFTFAAGSSSSAPGQIPIDVMRELETYL
ncbi:type I 3-dehydroquinate dehydratase [Salibacterium halotolerans]|uniref:3-dehydroquinate dehydratase n=1 Tax=Salibacterium halotolerans TaxID=1884432 RepID=A0A1I5L7A6_9BACI|nr:type I 3-dehydroquinate dehydratase [Salibacterium halotolerans]SFO93137.1 3-dehydroquinate dehydratase [Salibacterium halotolerans]